MDGLEILEQTGETATAALVFLHGAGETGKDAKDTFLKFMGKNGHEYIKIYFPTSKRGYLKIRDKITTFWFNCTRVGAGNDDVDVDIGDSNEVADAIERIIADVEASGIPRERIALGGASQGGMVSIFAAYVRGVKVGAVVSVASPFTYFQRKVNMTKNLSVPMLSLYGQKDAFIIPEVMKVSWQNFRSVKMIFEPKTLLFSGHFLDDEFIRIMFEWLVKKFPDLSD